MVKLSRILLVTFVLKVQDFAGCFQKVVIVDNKQMTFNRKGELVEIDKLPAAKNKAQNVEIVEKSNIFKNSAFVTKSKFNGANSNFKSGLITKDSFNQNRFPPVLIQHTSSPPDVSYNGFDSSTTSEHDVVYIGYSSTRRPVTSSSGQSFSSTTRRPVMSTSSHSFSTTTRRPVTTSSYSYSSSTTTRAPSRTHSTTRKPIRRKPATTRSPDIVKAPAFPILTFVTSTTSAPPTIMKFNITRIRFTPVSSTSRPITTESPFPPVRSHFSTRQPLRNKPKPTQAPNIDKLPPFPKLSFFSTTTDSPPSVSTVIVLDDDLSPVKNSLHDTYDDLYHRNDFMNYPRPRPQSIEHSTSELEIIYLHTTSSPFTAAPVVQHTTKKKTKKKKKKTTTMATSTHAPIDQFIQNLDFYRKVLMINCSQNETNKKNLKATTEQDVVAITPKPKLKVPMQNVKGHVVAEDEDALVDVGRKGKKKKKKKKKKKCKKKKKEHGQYYHDYGGSNAQVIYYDPPLVQHFDKAGDIFDTFYSFFEDAMTSKEFVDYGRDTEYSDSGEESEEHVHRRKKKSTDAQLQKRSEDSSSPRKSLTTKITVTSQYDDSIADETTQQNHSLDVSTKKPKVKKPKVDSSEESEEGFDLYQDIMGFRDDFDDSGDIEDDLRDSDEYYDDPPMNRLPEGDEIKSSVEDYSNENVNDEPSESIFDGVTTVFSSIGNFFSSLTGIGDESRKPPKEQDDYEDYDDEGRRRSTTEKVERQSKRPKRENEPLPWYQPSFLFAAANDDDKAVSSTMHPSWLDSSWQQANEDETDITTALPPTTTQQAVELKSVTKRPSLSLLEIVSQYWLPQKKLSSVKTTTKLRRKKYDNYQLWRIQTKSIDESEALDDFKMSAEGMKIHWLKGPSTKGSTDVVVAPEFIEHFKDFLADNEISFDVKIRDIQHAIHFENPRLNKRDQIELEVIHGHPLTWYRYHPYRDIQSYFDFLKRKFSDYVELIQVGWSFEGRPLTVVKVSHPAHYDASALPKEPRSVAKKPAIFIQSGSEAHEWLPIACATYVLNNLVSNIEGNDTMGDMIRSFDWYVISVLNPDGYDFSMSYERLWQKTRSKHFPSSGFWTSAMNWFKSPSNHSLHCYGTDTNNNFDYEWMQKGTSADECSDFYGGPYALSEPETKLFSNFLMDPRRNIEMFISLAGYGQKIAFPSEGVSPEKFEFVYDVARAGVKSAKASKSHGTRFTIDARRKKPGSIEQFAMHKANIKYSYTIEARDDATHGFFVPATSIEENAREIFDMISGMARSFY